MVAPAYIGITPHDRFCRERRRRDSSLRLDQAPARSQQGAVLVIGLAVLAVMTLLGIGAMRSSLLEERMSGNLREQMDAFEAAEAGLQAALGAIEARPIPPAPGSWGTGSTEAGCLSVDKDDSPQCSILDKVLADWRDANTPTSGVPMTNFGGAALSGVAQQPRVLVEKRFVPVNSLGFDEAARQLGIHFFSATALGTGTVEQSKVILQTTIAKVYY